MCPMCVPLKTINLNNCIVTVCCCFLGFLGRGGVFSHARANEANYTQGVTGRRSIMTYPQVKVSRVTVSVTKNFHIFLSNPCDILFNAYGTYKKKKTGTLQNIYQISQLSSSQIFWSD